MSKEEVLSPSETNKVGQTLLVDVGQLANILMQARGPILDRLSRQLPKLTGDGSVDVNEWVHSLERLCALEKADPADVVSYLLEGSALRLYRRMLVQDASQWSVVRATLEAEYAVPRQEAYRRFTVCRLEADEAVDVYVDRLERMAGRLGLTSEDIFFRVKFYEGLPISVYEWAVSHTRPDGRTPGHCRAWPQTRDCSSCFWWTG